jgi:hypothetical protein
MALDLVKHEHLTLMGFYISEMVNDAQELIKN